MPSLVEKRKKLDYNSIKIYRFARPKFVYNLYRQHNEFD